MTTRRRRWFIVASLLLAVFAGGIAWMLAFSPSEPEYGGKRLSVWLDELAALDWSRPSDPRREQPMQAVRAIGTNAIPWLLNEFRRSGSVWQWRLNQLLNKQRLLEYRFADINHRLLRATLGFRALGELGEPAIPDLLALVQPTPGYIPGALAGIGRPAVPALQQCLTNTTLSTNSLGIYAIIPGSTIVDIWNAANLGTFSKSDLAIFLPVIRPGRSKRQTPRRKPRRSRFSSTTTKCRQKNWGRANA